MSNTTTGPIFIIGANRSGTTLLRLMLNAHPRIAIPEELLYFRSDYAGVPIESWRTPQLSEPKYEELIRTFATNTADLHPELDAPALIDRILGEEPRDLRHPYQTVLDAWARLNGAARWGEKTPGNLFYVDIIHEMFPDAYFLYVVRDPRAGVASMQKADFFPDDVVFNAMSRRKHARVGPRLLDAHVAPDHWMTVRYEDLTTAPEATLRDICALIGETYEPAMLQYHRTAASYMKEKAATSFNAAATRPVTASKIDTWRDQFSGRDIAMIETICAEEMARHGYASESSSLPAGAYLELGVKEVYWSVQAFRNRHVRHYTVKHSLFARPWARLRRLLRSFLPAPNGSIEAQP
jgi:L-amino acid N-acyltransferase YncA